MGIARAALIAAALAGGPAAAQPFDGKPPAPIAVSPLSSLQMDGAHRLGEAGLDRPSLGIDKAALSWVMADFYPPASWRAREEGVTTVGACLDERGKVVKAVLVQFSGFPNLDAASLKMMAALPMKPATMNGKAVPFCGYALSVDWKMPAVAPPAESRPPAKP